MVTTGCTEIAALLALLEWDGSGMYVMLSMHVRDGGNGRVIRVRHSPLPLRVDPSSRAPVGPGPSPLFPFPGPFLSATLFETPTRAPLSLAGLATFHEVRSSTLSSHC